MNIATLLGLDIETFCRMSTTTKMLFSNIIGHAAELHYEKYMNKNNIKFERAPTDEHYDYIVNGERHQVKRFETDTTNENFIGVNLTKTHGDRSGSDAFYRRNDFNRLILFDVGFQNPIIIDVNNIPQNDRYNDRLPGKFRIHRENVISQVSMEFLKAMKVKNNAFPESIESFRQKYNRNYQELLEWCCNLTSAEIDSLFSEANFRLVTGVKGFAAEEHFNILLDKNNIPYVQNKEMYSKVDHWVKGKIRIQVKIPNERSNDSKCWGVKLHKSHGHGEGELCLADAFDFMALFIGFEMGEDSKYFPKNVSTKFIFVPMSDLPRHPEFPNYIKRICKIPKDKYVVNDLSIFT